MDEEKSEKGLGSKVSRFFKKIGSKNGLTKKIRPGYAILTIAVLLLVILAWQYRNLFVAATVDGRPISRLAVIKRLDQRSGKGMLDSLINEKLVENEAKSKGIEISDQTIEDEVKKIESQVTGQGTTLESALEQQGLTMEDLREQVLIQKQAEEILKDKVQVTDDEVNKYVTDNKITIPEGQEGEYKAQLKSQLETQKLNQEFTAMLEDLRAKAKIKYWVNY